MAAVESPFLDPYLSFLLAPPLKVMADEPKPPSVPAASLAEVLNFPPHVTRLLLDLAPSIARARWLANVISWQSSRTSESWLLLGAWWAICLMTGYSVRYLLPFALLATLPQLRTTQKATSIIATERTVHESLEHIARIQSLVPCIPPIPLLPPHVVFRIIALSWIPYILCTRLIGTRLLFALLGTLIITWRAPWARTLRTVFGASAFIRHGVSVLWSVLAGEPIPSASSPPTASMLNTVAIQEKGPSVCFLFTVYENQRWWVGLDWTAALVPSERPSWCGGNLQPVAPPSVFALPPPTTMYTSDEKGGRVKRTARWAWEEGEWKVVVRREVNGAPEVQRVEKQPLFAQEDLQASSKLAKKLKDAVSTPATSQDSLNNNANGDDSLSEPEEYLTDADGWTYFDNKWESPNNKGGIGKYTRFRRWTRIATLSETVEFVGPGELGIFKEKSSLALPPVDVQSTVTTGIPKDDHPTQDPGSPTTMKSEVSKGLESPTSLRQRLKAVVKSS